MTAAHCSALIAPVPLSVSRSISTCSAAILNSLKPALRKTSSRYSGVASRLGSTALIRKGSMIVFISVPILTECLFRAICCGGTRRRLLA